MDTALIIGASGGIGSALAATLRSRGVSVDGLSRANDGLDVTDQASVDRVLGGLTGPYDMICVATGALVVNGAAPEKSIKAVTAQALADQFAVNAIGPALVMRHVPRLLARDRRAVFAVLSARVGSIGDNRLGGWVSYRAAKAAVNQIVHTGAIELARSHRQAICVTIHPGTVATAFTQNYLGRHPAVPADTAAQNILTVLGELTDQDTGGFFDWSGARVDW